MFGFVFSVVDGGVVSVGVVLDSVSGGTSGFDVSFCSSDTVGGFYLSFPVVSVLLSDVTLSSLVCVSDGFAS